MPVDMLRRQGCVLCPRDRVELHSPKMAPSGADEPGVLCLGDAPGLDEDRRGEPFVGRAGRLLRSHIPRKWENFVAYSNVTQCWPGKVSDTTEVPLECCRPRVTADIERLQPVAIFGFGNLALRWAIGEARVMLWRGRRLPVQVGAHSCWFYPMLHPSDVLQRQEEQGWGDDEELFGWDLKRAFGELHRLPEPVVHSAAEARRGVTSITGAEPGAMRKVREWLAYAGQASHSGVDYETNRKRPYARGAKVLSAAVSVDDEALSFAFDHPEAGWSANDRAELTVAWTEFLSSDVVKVSHFAGFEQEWSGVMFGRDLVRASVWEDTASQTATLDERVGDHKNGPLSLGWQTLQNFGINIKKLSNLDRKNLEAEPLDAVLPYNGIDAKYHDKLWVAQNVLLVQRGLHSRYEFMNRRIPTVVMTQIKGIAVDPVVTAELAARYGRELSDIDAKIAMMQEVVSFESRRHGAPFNPGSGPDVKDLLRSELNIFLDSADEAALAEVDHPIASAIVRRRKIAKRKSTYVDAYMESFIGHDGKRKDGYLFPDGMLHHNLNTLFAETGRSSADEPNVQNVYKHTEEGKEVRKQIKPRPGHVYVSVDQGQIQGRNIAMESRDPVYCKMLWEDYDIHKEWAERLSRRYPAVVGGKKNFTDKDIMKEFRQKVKNKYVFPLFFGSKAESVCEPLGIPIEYVQPEYNEFWRILAGIRDWQEIKRKQYREHGLVSSLAGGIRRAPLSFNKIINSPIQDDEAAIVFNGYNRLSELDDWALQPIMEIHDDLLFEIPVEEVEAKTRVIVTEMLRCDFDWICVPLQVEVSIGEDWLHMEEVWKVRSDSWLGEPVRQKLFC